MGGQDMWERRRISLKTQGKKRGISKNNWVTATKKGKEDSIKQARNQIFDIA